MSRGKIFACAALLSQIVNAGTMGTPPSCPEVLFPKWDIGIDGLYLKPSVGGRNYIGTTSLNNDGTSLKQRFFDLDSDWGFRLDGKYYFDDSDLRVYWNRFSNQSRVSTLVDWDVNNGVPNDNGTAFMAIKWNDVHVELGQNLLFDNNKLLRIAGGVQYSSIEYDFSLYTTNIFGTANDFRNYKFEGVGPKIELDFTYMIDRKFNVFAKSSGAILIGQNNISYVSTNELNAELNITDTGKMKNNIVPAFAFDIGGAYRVHQQRGSIDVQGGWRASGYINALAYQSTQYNFAIQGPYIGIKWVEGVTSY